MSSFVPDVVAVILMFGVFGVLMVVDEESSEGRVERVSSSKALIVIPGEGGAASSSLMDTC